MRVRAAPSFLGRVKAFIGGGNGINREIVLGKPSRNLGIDEGLNIRTIDGNLVAPNGDLHLIPHVVHHIKLLAICFSLANFVEEIDHPPTGKPLLPKLDINSVPENSVSDIPKYVKNLTLGIT